MTEVQKEAIQQRIYEIKKIAAKNSVTVQDVLEVSKMIEREGGAEYWQGVIKYGCDLVASVMKQAGINNPVQSEKPQA